MNRQRILAGLAFAAVVVALIPSTPAHAGKSPVFSAPNLVEINAATGESVVKTIKFTNEGSKATGKLRVSFFADNPDLMLKSTTCQNKRVAPGSSCSSKVSYLSQVPNNASGELTIRGPVQSATTEVDATAAEASTLLTVSPTSHNFGSAASGQQTFTFTNNTGNAFSGSFATQVYPIGSDFTDEGGTCWLQSTLADGGTCTLIIGFNRNATGGSSAAGFVSVNGMQVSEFAEVSSEAGALPTRTQR